MSRSIRASATADGMKGGSSLWIGGTLVAIALFVAIAAPWIALTDPVMAANLMNAEIPPGAEFPFGTDMQGRDIYSRIVYGARISLTVGIVSQICNSIIGVSLGLSAGFWGGWWDDLVSGLTNLMLAIPSLISPCTRNFIRRGGCPISLPSRAATWPTVIQRKFGCRKT